MGHGCINIRADFQVGMSEETGQLESIKRKINEWGERKKKEKRAGIELATNVWETSILPLN